MNMQKIVWLKLRFVMALIFLWAFFDKVFGLGFATTAEKAWVNGASPTYGFLAFATEGPFAGVFKSVAGMAVVDWMFMLGLLFVGLTFLFNRYIFWGALAGSIMMFLMWLATFPPENNPLIDEHIVYMLVFAVLVFESRRGRLGLR